MEISEGRLRALVREVDEAHRAGMTTLARDIRVRQASSRFQRTGAGVFALRAWGLPDHPHSLAAAPPTLPDIAASSGNASQPETTVGVSAGAAGTAIEGRGAAPGESSSGDATRLTRSVG